MRRLALISILAPSLAAAPAGAAVDPAPRYAVTGGKVVTVSGCVLDGAMVLVAGGRIDAVSRIPATMRRLPATRSSTPRADGCCRGSSTSTRTSAAATSTTWSTHQLGLRVLDTIRPDNP